MKKRLWLASAVAFLGFQGVADAQQGAQPVAPRVAETEDTIVITAEKRAQNIQDVPIAVTAFTEKVRDQLAISTVQDLTNYTPGVAYQTSLDRFYIRGIGRATNNLASDGGTAIYSDGVYTSSSYSAATPSIFVDRTEILRGPQGTLYGRNAVGGSLNLISRLPSSDFEASARMTAGNLGELRVDARASGALKRDRLMGSVAFARGIRDGYVRDLEHPDHPLGGDDIVSARGQLQIIVDRRTSVLISADVNDQSGTLLTFNKVLQVKPGFVVDNPADLHEVRTSTQAASSLRHAGAAVRLTSALTPTTTLVSLTAFRTLDNEFLVDADITEIDVLSTHNVERQDQFSEEITISQQRGWLTWVGGFFFFHEDDRQTLRVDQPQARAQVLLNPVVAAMSGALFAETIVALSPQWSLTTGLRYTRERKDIDNSGGRYYVGPPTTLMAGTGYGYADRISHGAWTPKFVVSRSLTERGMAYGSATRGFKSGGFNPSSTQPGRGFAPEWAWSYEGGVKIELLDRRVRTNLAAFHMDYTNLQVQTPIGIGVFDISNAAAATIRGIEAEASARLGRGFNAGGHVTWLDATYDHYVAVGIGGISGDVAGRRLNNAPEWAGRLWFEWLGRIGRSGRLAIAADATAQSTVFFTPFNDTIQRQLPYGLLGARAEIGPSHLRWSINIFGRNLTDTDYIMATFGTAPTAFGGRPGLSRQFGLQFAVRH